MAMHKNSYGAMAPANVMTGFAPRQRAVPIGMAGRKSAARLSQMPVGHLSRLGGAASAIRVPRVTRGK